MTTTAPASVILIRVVVGGVFFSEGIQKFLSPNDLGAGRFVKIGIPAPEAMGPFVGTVEIVCGSLIVLGLLTRLAAIRLIIDMCVALISTKLPILLGHGFWRFRRGSLRECFLKSSGPPSGYSLHCLSTLDRRRNHRTNLRRPHSRRRS